MSKMKNFLNDVEYLYQAGHQPDQIAEVLKAPQDLVNEAIMWIDPERESFKQITVAK